MVAWGLDQAKPRLSYAQRQHKGWLVLVACCWVSFLCLRSFPSFSEKTPASSCLLAPNPQTHTTHTPMDRPSTETSCIAISTSCLHKPVRRMKVSQ